MFHVIWSFIRLQDGNQGVCISTSHDISRQDYNICVLVGFSRSLRNCSLQGPIPDLSGIPQLGYMLVALFYFPFLDRKSVV